MQIVTPEGFPAELWHEILDAAPSMRPAELAVPAGASLLVLGAHPDDETIGCGRLIAHWAKQIGPVTVVSLSAGEACLDHLDIRIPHLAAIRRAELRAAGEFLAVDRTECCGLPDGDLVNALPAVQEKLIRLISSVAVVAAPWQHDPHPDHAAIGAAAAAGCRLTGRKLLEYPIWTTYWQRPSVLAQHDYRVIVVDTDPADDAARRRALACYRSQQEPLRADLSPVVPAAMLEHHQQQLILLPGGHR